jgi:hypothetical protein
MQILDGSNETVQETRLSMFLVLLFRFVGLPVPVQVHVPLPLPATPIAFRNFRKKGRMQAGTVIVNWRGKSSDQRQEG